MFTMTTPTKGVYKRHALFLLQIISAIGIAVFGFRHILTTGEVNRVFFPSQNEQPFNEIVPVVEQATVAPPPPPAPLVLTENYYQLAMEGKIGTILEPMEVMREYISQHSQEVLQAEYSACHSGNDPSACQALNQRQFLVAAYACPHYAGRRLHTFMNGLIWSVVTNRTFLWFYMNDEFCHMQEEAWRASDCNRNNTKADCDAYMQLSDWMPNYFEWNNRLNITENDIVRANFDKRDKWARPHDQDGAPRVITHGQQAMLLPGVDLTRPIQRTRLLGKKWTQELAGKFFYYGHYFTYGMLQEVLFTLKGDVFEAKKSNTKTYAFHSRYPRHLQWKNYYALEKQCIAQLEPVANDTSNNGCIVYMMMDNHNRWDGLSGHVKDAGCSVHRMEHVAVDDHAYFRDWVFLRHHARSGFFAPHRTRRPGIGMRGSSALLRESMEFRRVMEEGPDAQLLNHHECFDGYDWGDGPTNCTRVDLIASSFGVERYTKVYGIIHDPCVYKWRNDRNKTWHTITEEIMRRPGRSTR
jgi:hypothetical protein